LAVDVALDGEQGVDAAVPRDSSVVRWATAAGSSAFAVQEGA
jgi:hypothetical protein